MKDLVASARASSDKFNIGVTFVGSTNHLPAELFKSIARIDVPVAPFKTTPALIAGIRSNEAQAIFEFIRRARYYVAKLPRLVGRRHRDELQAWIVGRRRACTKRA